MECVKFDNPSKGNMSEYALREASGLLKTIAGARRADESVKAVFHRLSRDLKDWSYGRIRAVWYCDQRVKVRDAEIEQLRALAGRQKRQKIDESEFAELRSTVERLAKYEALLARIDAEFFSAEISAARDQVGQASGLLGTRGLRR